MDSENRNKRDLPEVVADILIVLDKVLQTQEQMQQTQQQQHEQLIHAFNTMTNAVLDAMNRQAERYDRTLDTQASQETEVRELKQRVENLEKTVYNKAS